MAIDVSTCQSVPIPVHLRLAQFPPSLWMVLSLKDTLLLAQSPDLKDQVFLISIMLDTAPQWLKQSRQWKSLKVLIWKIGRGLWEAVGGGHRLHCQVHSLQSPSHFVRYTALALGSLPCAIQVSLLLQGSPIMLGCSVVTLPHWKKEQESERS